jgi:hypothetical protein
MHDVSKYRKYRRNIGKRKREERASGEYEREMD